MIDMRPHFDGEEGKHNAVVFDSDELSLSLADTLLTTLADVVCHAGLTSEQCLWLLYGIGKLRGQLYRESTRICAEVRGRDN